MKDLALNLVMPLYFLNLAAPSFFLAIDFLKRDWTSFIHVPHSECIQLFLHEVK